jgi:hypothetical protein
MSNTYATFSKLRLNSTKPVCYTLFCVYSRTTSGKYPIYTFENYYNAYSNPLHRACLPVPNGYGRAVTMDHTLRPMHLILSFHQPVNMKYVAAAR